VAELEFRSKVDWVFIVGAAVSALGGVFGFVVAAREGHPWIGASAFMAIAIVAWVWASTRYVITHRSLLVRCAFVRMDIPIESIQGVRRTSSILSAPALSLDRIEVRHRRGSVVLSPRERDRFIQALRSRNPAIEVEVTSTGTASDSGRDRGRR
jgi:hypothetical protein